MIVASLKRRIKRRRMGQSEAADKNNAATHFRLTATSSRKRTVARNNQARGKHKSGRLGKVASKVGVQRVMGTGRKTH